ncbi:MAG: tRNA uridine-5-carboxymethylaminomethyl(34) synthesis GTPase MnmE [Treponema sp.]|jgi:tRNA modification GTPase|nr:tRNA uridine-5-carboxymethylaminomethyl(34) synthesis GTPase MnmE [Treponema sp.]
MGNREKPAYGDALPIAALATPRSASALALIRLSGTGSLELLASLFSRPDKLLRSAGNRVIHGWLLKPQTERTGAAAEDRLDEVLIACYRSPQSYTGEDGADITCHGGAASSRAILEALGRIGFREALPGEFTFRAFMRGKLDLTRAEAVMELVAAKTDQGRARAVGRLSGVLEAEIHSVKQRLVQVLAATELFLDYSEDEAGLACSEEEAGRLPDQAGAEEALMRLERLAASYRRERLYQDGALAVIAGRPNAGKSSLFNLLLREERAIVTDIPGTTRDWIEAWIALEGIPIRLADTAGLHDSEDPVERLGITRSRELLEAADLVFYLLDGSAGLTPEDRDFFSAWKKTEPPKRPPLFLLWNKADLIPLPASLAAGTELAPACLVLGISAKTGEGIPALMEAAAAALETAAAAPEGPAALGSPRQKERIDAARNAVAEALALSKNAAPLDIIAPLLREGVNALGELSGEVSTAEILETMFSQFCVGK